MSISARAFLIFFSKQIAIPTHIFLQNLASIQPRIRTARTENEPLSSLPALRLPPRSPFHRPGRVIHRAHRLGADQGQDRDGKGGRAPRGGPRLRTSPMFFSNSRTDFLLMLTCFSNFFLTLGKSFSKKIDNFRFEI